MTDKGSWLVFGRIVGAHLPTKPVKIGNALLGPMPYEGTPLERTSGKITLSSPELDSCFYSYTDMQLISNCLFWIISVEDTSEAAIEAVRTRDLPLLQTALSVRRPQGPYLLQVLWAEKDGQRRGSPVKSNFGIWTKSEMSQDAIERARIDFTALAGDEKALQAARHFSEAIMQSATATTPLHEEAVLLSLFKVIEGMSRMVPASNPQEYETAQLEVIDRLQASLQLSAPLEYKTEALHSANRDLKRLKGHYLSLRIAAMATLLRLPDGWRRAADEFISFRNRRLGHSGPSTTSADRTRWLDWNLEYPAWTLARTLLAAYADHKALKAIE